MTAARAIAVFFGVVLALLHQPNAVYSASSAGPAAGSGSHVAGEVLVKFRPTQSSAQKQSSIRMRNHSVKAELPRGWVRAKITAGQSVPQALAAYQNDPNVESVQPNFIYRKAAVPNDSQYEDQWGLKNTGQTVSFAPYSPNAGTPGRDINIEKAWDHITDCSSVLVAVIDSGINYNHLDLVDNMWDGSPTYPHHGRDFVDNDDDPMDVEGHGSHVAGSLAARGNNFTGVAGVCWRAKLMAVRVLDATGSGTTTSVIDGIDFAVANGAKVINMSLGGTGGFDQAFSDAISNAQAADVVVVVAAGNSNANVDGGTPFYPCAFTQPNLICVAALDQNYDRATFSNYGALSVDVGAPGTNIVSSSSVRLAAFYWEAFAGWTRPPGSHWGDIQLPLNVGTVPAMVNPITFPDPFGLYANNADERIYKNFDLSGPYVSAVLRLSVLHFLQPGDFLNINYRNGGGDPFVPDGVRLDQHFGSTGGLVEGPLEYDLGACLVAACSVGFQLTSDMFVAGQGVGIVFMTIDLFRAETNSYSTLNGTSMASPVVAGLATMLRAYNPQFTYVEVVNAIRNGGRPVAALNGITTTGKAIDVMSSLAYINQPTGLSASVVP